MVALSASYYSSHHLYCYISSIVLLNLFAGLACHYSIVIPPHRLNCYNYYLSSVKQRAFFAVLACYYVALDGLDQL